MSLDKLLSGEGVAGRAPQAMARSLPCKMQKCRLGVDGTHPGQGKAAKLKDALLTKMGQSGRASLWSWAGALVQQSLVTLLIQVTAPGNVFKEASAAAELSVPQQARDYPGPPCSLERGAFVCKRCREWVAPGHHGDSGNN